MVDPDLELRGWGSLDFLALLALFLSVISSFFTQNKGGGPGSPGPSPRSTTGIACLHLSPLDLSVQTMF